MRHERTTGGRHVGNHESVTAPVSVPGRMWYPPVLLTTHPQKLCAPLIAPCRRGVHRPDCRHGRDRDTCAGSCRTSGRQPRAYGAS
jgi:hypothetical protein